jgi:hypothetical protein
LHRPLHRQDIQQNQDHHAKAARIVNGISDAMANAHGMEIVIECLDAQHLAEVEGLQTVLVNKRGEL